MIFVNLICEIQQLYRFTHARARTHTHTAVLLIKYVFLLNMQINLRMTSQWTKHLNATVGVWPHFYWPPGGEVEHYVKSFESPTQFSKSLTLL